jgi:hypothetical protein
VSDQRLEELLARQSGVVARRQAVAAGLAACEVRRLLRRREWVVVHQGVYVDHTGPPSWLQRAWAATLLVEDAALSHESALRAAVGAGRRGSDEEAIHIAVDRRRNIDPPPGVVRHYVTDLSGRVLWNASPPRVRVEHAALDLAAASATDFDAIAQLAQVVQSRRTTVPRLLAALEARQRLSRSGLLSAVLVDIGSGACSVLEHGYLERVERRHGLPRAARQVRDSARGPLYRDVEYTRQTTVVELDGRLFHDSARARDRDLDRDLDAVVEGKVTVRLGWGQVFGRSCATAARVGRLLQVRGWEGAPRRCPECRADLVPRRAATG